MNYKQYRLFEKVAVSGKLIEKIILKNPKYLRNVREMYKYQMNNQVAKKAPPVLSALDDIGNISLEGLRARNELAMQAKRRYDSLFSRTPRVKKVLENDILKFIKSKKSGQLGEVREVQFG